MKTIKKIIKALFALFPRDNVKIEIATTYPNRLLLEKRIIITGGGKGLGYYMAKKFIAEGAYVLITGRNKDTLIKASNELGEKCFYKVFDQTHVEYAQKLIIEAEKLMGGVDILVNNAGISFHEGKYNNVTIEGFDQQMNTNLRSHFFIAQAFLNYKLKEHTEGNILFISSNTSGKCVDIPYGLSKAAINSLVGALSRRVYRKGIRINAIAPGVVHTEMTKTFTDVKNGNMQFDAPSGRLFLPEEISEVACFLISDVSKCISGEFLFCDGGNHLNVNLPETDN